MTSIERAKSFILGKGRAIALTLVPLAALATIHVPARAGTVGRRRRTWYSTPPVATWGYRAGPAAGLVQLRNCARPAAPPASP